MKKLIGITSSKVDNAPDDYSLAVELAGGCPIILSRVKDVRSLDPILNMLDGIIFSGGSDLSPLYYSEAPIKELQAIDDHKDNFEITLAKYILEEKKMPILGICRGMQLLNVVAGGTLYQDIHAQNATTLVHNQEGLYAYDSLSHMVNVEKTSRLFEVFGTDKISVNSYHHQAVKDLAKNFTVAMRSEDNIIEGIEMNGDRFVVGIQWHPERLVHRYPAYVKFFKFFIDACGSEE